MQWIRLKSIPKIRFAHTYAAPTYENRLPKIENCIEISYLAEGTSHSRQGNVSATARQYNISCNLYREETFVQSEAFHEHHTVSFYIDYEPYDSPAQDAAALPRITPVSGHVYAHELIDEIIRIHTIEPQRSYAVSGLFLQLLDEVSRLAKGHTDHHNANASLYVLKAKEYIYRNLHRPIQQKEIAEYLNITPEYLCNVFKKTGGESLITFINRVKLSKMHSLMEQENLKLFEAAEIYGYNNPNYVSRLYKKYFGYNITESKTMRTEK